MIDRDGVAPGRVHVIPNAVLPAVSTAADRVRYRNAWGYSPGQLVIGCVANYKPEKGLGLLIDAAARLRDQLPELRVVIVGEGPLRNELEADIRDRQLESIVRLHGAEPDARPLYSAFDMYVQASQTEGLPNVILEAAAVGLPIVATAVGGTSEIITAEENGLLIPSYVIGSVARRGSAPRTSRRIASSRRRRRSIFA